MNSTAGFSGHTTDCDCWRCCEADMAVFISAELGLDPATYGLGQATNNQDTAKAGRGGAATGTARTRLATPAQVSYIKRLIASRNITGIDVPDVIDGISFTRARRLLDQLTAAKQVHPDKASPEQMDYIQGLLEAKAGPAIAGMRRDIDNLTAANGYLTRGFASDIITYLKAQPDAPKKHVVELVAPGMYVLEGQIWRVKRSRGGRVYASLLDVDRMRFDYACGAISKLKPEHRMTAEAAARFGQDTGSCCVCARTLTRRESIERGIGPVCLGKV